MLYKGSFAAEVTFLCRKSLIWLGRTLEMTLDFKARSRKLKSMPQPPFPLGATQADIEKKGGQGSSRVSTTAVEGIVRSLLDRKTSCRGGGG